MIHNVSALHVSKISALDQFHNDICDVEESLKTKNAIVVGDFNVHLLTVFQQRHCMPFLMLRKR